MEKILLFLLLLETLTGYNLNFLKEIDYKTKLGQILVVNILPNEKPSFIKTLIKDYKIGNFNLIGSYRNEKEVKKIINTIKIEGKKYLNLSPLICVDEEGAISRLIFLNSLPQKELKNPDKAYKEALRRGKELKRLGFNLVFSPVLDYATERDYIWDRTFQSDKENSILLGISMINGYKDAGIISIPKHFPGYINLEEDPHGNIVSNKSLKIYSNSIEIFKKVIESTNPLGIMFAHVVIDEFGEKPITRSKNFVDFFRKNFNYSGILVTDSVGMRSFKMNDSFSQSSLEALISGYNLLILPSNKKESLKIIEYLYKNLDREDIKSAIDKSFTKIYIIKKFFLTNYESEDKK
jgi:beta-N-acetylhexosaminidase